MVIAKTDVKRQCFFFLLFQFTVFDAMDIYCSLVLRKFEFYSTLIVINNLYSNHVQLFLNWRVFSEFSHSDTRYGFVESA